ncbi:MAG: hypothetical protein IT381_16485 [Deltaproteobacteria bacterium]|nr:hypothetical protein [Deltaproteobacteria bacterium]
MLQVDATSVINWSKKGYLAVYRTPGGHRRIRAADVVEFAQKRGMPVPLSLDALNRHRVLVLERDGAHINNWRKAFESLARRVTAVFTQTSQMALIELGTFKPHLLIMDASFEALTLAELIKRKGEYRELRVIIVGEQGSAEMMQKAKALGVSWCLRPRDVAEMARVTGQGVAA